MHVPAVYACAHTFPVRQTSGYLNLLANCVDNFTHGLAVAGSFLVSKKVRRFSIFLRYVALCVCSAQSATLRSSWIAQISSLKCSSSILLVSRFFLNGFQSVWDSGQVGYNLAEMSLMKLRRTCKPDAFPHCSPLKRGKRMKKIKSQCSAIEYTLKKGEQL